MTESAHVAAHDAHDVAHDVAESIAINIALPAELHRSLRVGAALRGITIKQAVVEALTAWTASSPS